jgi:hypothetical protein
VTLNNDDFTQDSAIGGKGGNGLSSFGPNGSARGNAYGGRDVHRRHHDPVRHTDLSTGGSLLSTGKVTLTGGTFELTGNNQTIGDLSGTGGTVNLNANSLTVTTTTADVFGGRSPVPAG